MVSADIWRLSNIFKMRNDRKFVVPRYQRGYAWEDKHIIAFCEDLWKTDKTIGEKHPFGTLYTETTTGQEKIKIIDGQQRVTSTAIFLSVVRDFIDEFSPGHKVADDLNEYLYLYDTNLLSPDTNSPTLTLGLLNNDYFKRAILKRKTFSSKLSDLKKTGNDSDENIRDAYKDIREFISKKFKESEFKDDISKQILKLNHLTNTLLTNFELIHIDVPTELEAYQMFNTINHRGLQLAEDDLIKHLLFTQLDKELTLNSNIDKDEKLNEYDASWTELRNKITQEDLADYELNNFIHHHLVVFNSKDAKKDNIYEEVDAWNKLNSSTEIIETLVDWGDDFYNLRKPEDYFRGEPEITYYLKKIKDLSYLTIYPLIIAGYEQFWKHEDKMSFRKLVEICFKYHLRNKLIARVNVTPFEAILKKTARELYEGIKEKDESGNEISRDATIKDVVNSLISDENVHRDKSIVEDNLNRLSVPNGKLASSLLQEIEKTMDSEKNPGDDVSVEHIMPSSKTKWIDYIKEKHGFSDEELVDFHKKFKNYLGNQVLLSLPKNRTLSNKPFDEKKLVYTDSGYKITSRISNYDSWTEKEILETQEEYKNKLIQALDIEKLI